MKREKRRELQKWLEQVLKDRPEAQEFVRRLIRSLVEQGKQAIIDDKHETQDFSKAILSDSLLDRLTRDVLASRGRPHMSAQEIDAEVEPKIKKLIEEGVRMPLGTRYGRPYCTILTKLVPLCLGPIVNIGRIRTECAVTGGWVDFEMPLRLSMLRTYPLWQAWRQDFGIRRILVESKNLKGRAGPDEVGQVLRYQETADAGKLALLVSRNGFTPAAMSMMSRFARGRERLIIPFTQNELRDLAEASIAGREACMDYLNEQQLSLAVG